MTCENEAQTRFPRYIMVAAVVGRNLLIDAPFCEDHWSTRSTLGGGTWGSEHVCLWCRLIKGTASWKLERFWHGESGSGAMLVGEGGGGGGHVVVITKLDYSFRKNTPVNWMLGDAGVCWSCLLWVSGSFRWLKICHLTQPTNGHFNLFLSGNIFRLLGKLSLRETRKAGTKVTFKMFWTKNRFHCIERNKQTKKTTGKCIQDFSGQLFFTEFDSSIQATRR